MSSNYPGVTFLDLFFLSHICNCFINNRDYRFICHLYVFCCAPVGLIFFLRFKMHNDIRKKKIIY